MAFTVHEYEDLARLLAEHPEWQSELRRLLLADDFLQLPRIVRDLVEAQRRTEERVNELVQAQRRTEERVARLETAMAALVEAQRRTEERVGRLETAMAALVEAQQRTEERMAALVEAQQRTEERLAQLAEGQQRHETAIGDLRGRVLELDYRGKPSAYFSRLLRRVRLVDGNSLEDLVEGRLSTDEVSDLLATDIILRGRPLVGSTDEVLIAMEVSATVDPHDVERAGRRAELLRRAGHRAVPVAAGIGVTADGKEAARAAGVALLQDGTASFWEDALARQAP